MEKENVINKIRKLLKLQYNAENIGSTGEAYQCAKIVKKLLMDYNLSLSDIDMTADQKSIKISESTDFASGSMYGNQWKFSLLEVIAVNNLCKSYKRQNGGIFVLGTDANVTIVKEFFIFSHRCFVVRPKNTGLKS